jgi:hypothetical protein
VSLEAAFALEGYPSFIMNMPNFWTQIMVVLAALFGGTAASNSLDTRWLEDYNEEFVYALSGFSVKFQKCQYVKMYDDNLAQDGDSETVLAVNHFVVFKLCPTDECSTCSSVHGQYVVDVADYLSGMVEFQQAQLESMCANCNDDTCGELCYRVENLAANGYVDASAYAQCQQLKSQNKNNDGEQDKIYIGPQCSSNGKNITIGLFTDQYCVVPYSLKTVEEALGYKLSYHLLENTYSATNCQSCMESENNNKNNKNNDKDNVNEMCEDVYKASAKCESKYGLTSGLVHQDRKNGKYENQAENEFMVCTFIDSLIWNSYTETGEINYKAVQDEIIREATTVQKGALAMVSLALVGLLIYGSVLDRQIDHHRVPIGLHASEGHMS